MSLLNTHTAVVLSLCSVVAGIPAARTTCPPCPEHCDDEWSHPGCIPPEPYPGCTPKYCMVESSSMARNAGADTMDDLVGDLEGSVDNLRVMVAALLALVLLLLLGVVLIILKLYLPSVFKCFKRRSGPVQQRRPTKTQDLRELSVSTIRLANHQQSSESPCPIRISKRIPHSTPVAVDKQQPAPPTRRMRQPSESTCPEESSETHQGYDNLGLSTSTLHNQTSSSTSSSNRSLSGVMNSTRTMNTTLPDHTPHNSLSTRI